MKTLSTKRALLASVLSFLLCVAMLVGSTFAWFTDTATASVNTIMAGNLDIELQMKNNDGDWVNAEGKTLPFLVDGKIPTEGTEILWEPGCTYYVPEVRVYNKGNLAVKFEYLPEALGVTGALAEVLTPVFKAPVDENGGDVNIEPQVLKPGEFSPAWSFGYHMDEKAGNTYQNATASGIRLTVVATQATSEKDSNGYTYDEGATYPLISSVREMQSTLTLADIPKVSADSTERVPVQVTLGSVDAEDINYSEHSTGYQGKGIMLGNANLSHYSATPAERGEYTFIFKDGTVHGTVTGYQSIDGPTTNALYLLVPGNSDVVFENMTFEGVVSFNVQKYTSPWSNLNSISFKNCVFNGIVVGTCPAEHVTFDGCTFENYTNTTYANNSNPIWWRADYEGEGTNARYIRTFTFINNTVKSTRPVKIERIGRDGCDPVFTFKNNYFDIKKQAGDEETKNMAINIGQWDANSKFTLIDEGNTISSDTASLYTAAIGSGSNQYLAVSGNKVLDGNGNNKTIIAMVWKTTTGETFEMKTIN